MSSDAEASSLAVSKDLGPRAPLLEITSAYDRVFWLAYVANALITTANAMLVRYADFVDLIGGREGQLGAIVGFGMMGSIAMRLVQGMGMDRYGAGRIWRLSVLVYVLSLFAHLMLFQAHISAVFVVRALMQTSLAGVFGASITFVSLRVPPQRMAEMIGTLGTSGFIGILVGPLISDWIFDSPGSQRAHVEQLFLVAGTAATLAMFAAWLAASRDTIPTFRPRPSLLGLLRRYTPIHVALVSAAMGAGFAIPATFLRPFVAELGLSRIGIYFSVYAVSAFAARLSTRQLFERYGNRPWIAVGMALLTLSFLLYLPVEQTWHLAAPGAVAGVAHALLFPSVMSAGTTAFPTRYRGIATSLMLAMFDLGNFLGAPVVGTFLQFSRHTIPSRYSVMFAGTAALFLMITLLFCSARHREELGEEESTVEGLESRAGSVG